MPPALAAEQWAMRTTMLPLQPNGDGALEIARTLPQRSIPSEHDQQEQLEWVSPPLILIDVIDELVQTSRKQQALAFQADMLSPLESYVQEVSGTPLMLGVFIIASSFVQQNEPSKSDTPAADEQQQ